MGSPGLYRSAQLIAINAGLVLVLAGCSAAGGLFGSNASDGAGKVASNAGTIADAVDWVTGPSDSYCRKEAAAADAGMVQIYKVEAGECAAGDSTIKEYEYNEIKAENEQRAWDKLHAVAVAEAAKPTYCRTAAAQIAYRSSSKTCQPGEAVITEEEYDAAKAEAAAARLP